VSAAKQELITSLPIHDCVDCRNLPIRPFAKADEEPGVDYRPRKPLAITSGKTKRSFRCYRHTQAKRKADLFDQRIAMRAKRRGLSRELQILLWEYQGCQCPCGRKRSKEIPPGVALDHVHGAPCIVAGEHDKKTGCRKCVTGFMCAHCNTEIIGRLEGANQKLPDPRIAVREALRNLADHVEDPPWLRLIADRPELLDTA
jgi:hypothetical protein